MQNTNTYVVGRDRVLRLILNFVVLLNLCELTAICFHRTDRRRRFKLRSDFSVQLIIAETLRHETNVVFKFFIQIVHPLVDKNS